MAANPGAHARRDGPGCRQRQGLLRTEHPPPFGEAEEVAAAVRCENRNDQGPRRRDSGPRLPTPSLRGRYRCWSIFHGGGWVIGGLDTHDGTCRLLLCREADCVVVSVGYRLAPGVIAIRQLQRIAIRRRSGRPRTPPKSVSDASRIAVGGDSAGGNLAAAVALMARDRGAPSLAFQLLIYPVTDADFTRGLPTSITPRAIS